ncbi:hypothetical protein E3C22_19995 [Jiella endophytica]|uniref:DUF4399 domain-containing protein n=1 Tax=Jiella endophytica TaxID=2558362 RepID=A0A4Y8RCZ5_9HYPH|nr:DUF6130 family protein [Jiella endophytica]TFF19939.1 hypothetical protein E3C22_19995 [Jiella endophytica]
MFRVTMFRRAPVALALSLLLGGVFAATSLLAEDREPPQSLFVRVAEEAPLPKIVARAEKDADGEWTVSMAAENFRFTEICKAVEGSEVVGHVHIYEGDRKLVSAYAPEKSIGRLSPGRHELTITLQATDHRAFATKDGMITARLVIEA